MPVNVKSEDNGIAAPVGMMNVEDDDSLHPVTSTAAAAAVTAIMHDDDDMEDDPIVREVDVYLSPALADQIYLLQYPLQQTPLKLPTAARIKPRHAQMELDFPIIPVVGGVGQQQAAAHGRGAFPFMKSRVFQSQTIPVETHMCLGQLQIDDNDNDDNDYTKSSLHLVPLQHISQMRPSFRHVEENADPDAAAVDGQDGDDHHDQDDYVTAEAEKKPIVFQRKESERAAMIRKSSYAYKKASHDAEEWQDLIVCDAKSPEYRSNLQQILVQQSQPQESELILAPLRHNKADNSDDNDDIDTTDDPEEEDWTPPNMNYIQSLNYVKVSAQDEDMARASAPSSSTTGDNAGGAMTADNVGSSSSSSSSNSDIKNIIARMTVLLGNGGPIPYSILRDQFITTTTATTTTGSVSSMTDAKLFQALSICAVLVRGNFCLHSKFLSLSKSMQRARTFLLLLFQKYQTVQKSRLSQIDLHLLHLDDTTPSTSSSSISSAQQQQQQQVVTLDKLHVLLQQVGKRTNAVVNAVDYNPNHHNHNATTASANSAAAPGWVLRVEDNLAFVAAHPQEAAQHLTYWNRLSTASPRIKQLLEQYNNATINGAAADDTNDHDDSDSMMQY